jgi:tetrahydromethanopterin S-methyltransferase subunit B
MKKKKNTRTEIKKQKIDVVLESLLNLEIRVKELIKKVEQLENKSLYAIQPQNPQLPSEPVYWPNKWPHNKPEYF